MVDGKARTTACRATAGAATGAVRCCGFADGSADDSICPSTHHKDSKQPLTALSDGVGEAVSFAEAEAECLAQGAMLCTAAQLERGGSTWNTGCGYNNDEVWSYESCATES